MSREAFTQVLASLAAAISLLERGGKKAAASDRMFEQMLDDYRAALEAGRNAISQQAERSGYACHKCKAETPPPEPYSSYVVCPGCGASTAATAAQAIARPAQTEQQPVAWVYEDGEVLLETDFKWNPHRTRDGARPLYAAPIAQTAQGVDHD